MTVPATYTGVYRVICNAYREAGKLARGQDPDGDMLADGINRWNDMANFLQTKGMKLFLIQDITIPLVAGQQLYTVGPGGTINMARPTQIIDGYYLDSSNNSRPLIPVAWADWVRFSNRTEQGALNSYFVDKQAAVLNLRYWLTPDTEAATGVAHQIMRTQIGNATGLTDTNPFPVEWYLPLVWIMADELTTGQPESVQNRCKMKADAYKEDIEAWDVEDAPTMFQPDSRGTNQGSRFR